GIRDFHVTGVQTCALPISMASSSASLTLTSLIAIVPLSECRMPTLIVSPAPPPAAAPASLWPVPPPLPHAARPMIEAATSAPIRATTGQVVLRNCPPCGLAPRLGVCRKGDVATFPDLF